MIKVKLPAAMKKDAASLVELEPVGIGTVSDVLGQLVEIYPVLGKKLFKETGHLNRFVNVFVNSEDIRFVDNLGTPVKDGDEIDLISAIAGG